MSPAAQIADKFLAFDRALRQALQHCDSPHLRPTSEAPPPPYPTYVVTPRLITIAAPARG